MDSVGTQGGPLKPPDTAPLTLREWADVSGSGSVRHALHLVGAGAGPVLLTGPAGTGKSHFLALYRAEAVVRTVVLASTGIAALQVGGQTVHSYFRLPHRVLTPGDLKLEERGPLYAAIEVLIVDEVSMLRGDVIDAIDVTLRRARRCDMPFGGVRVLLVGDPYQLAPVVDDTDAEALAQLGYESPWFFHAKEFREVPLDIAALDRIHRQTDPAFARLLSHVRGGELPVADRTYLNSRVSPEFHLTGQALVLTTTRASAGHANDARLADLPAPESAYHGLLEGEFPRNELPSPRHLVLKPGARVLFTRNDVDRRWANGTTGTVVACETDAVLIRTDCDPAVEHRVTPVTWEYQCYRYNGALKRVDAEVVGRYTQIPCVLGWAATIHRCQGMTLDRVRVDLGSGAFAAGQAYVALSRVRTAGGLELVRPIRARDVWADEEVIRFMDEAVRSRSGHDAA